jgi:glycosyltransferase involved in cell wall biosynthesis
MNTSKDPFPSTRSEISAFVICLNEEKRIRRCLESLKWCDEIIIVDSGSTDATLDICREYTSKIFHNDWPGYVAQKRFGLELCTREWVLNLDADEEVSDALRDEILREVLDPKRSTGINGFFISRVVNYMNRWWRRGGWYPEYRLRLGRKAHTSWGGHDPHEKALVSGPVKRLGGELFHYTYFDITDHVRRLNSYSSTAARSLFSHGKRSSSRKLFLNPLSRFFKFYILKKGFLEGFPGFLVACLEGYYVFLKYVKLWELERLSKFNAAANPSE